MALGLPNITIIFKGLAASAIERSERGIVACIVKDDTEGGQRLSVYESILDIDFEHMTEANYGYLKLLFEGGPVRVIVLRESAESPNLAAALKELMYLRWNYLCYPDISDEDKTTLAAWIKEMRDKNHKTFKAVLAASASDHEGIINLTTDGIESSITGKTHTAKEYCARIAGVLAGLSLSRSSTYYVLGDVLKAECPSDPDERINKGEFILVFDGEKYKVGRGVNSLTTFTKEKTEDVRKIKIVEGMDLYQDDIRNTFTDSYVGKYVNDYDNKQLFVAAVLAYQAGLAGEVLDASYDNTASVDAQAQKQYLQERGQDVSQMTETEILTANTGAQVFIASHVKFVDAMEDLQMTVNM